MTEKLASNSGCSEYINGKVEVIDSPEMRAQFASVFGEDLSIDQCVLVHFMTLLKQALSSGDVEFVHNINFIRETITRYVLNPDAFELNQSDVQAIRDTITSIAFQVLTNNGPWYEFCITICEDPIEAGDLIVAELRMLLSLQSRLHVDTMRARLCLIINPESP
jgi:hypothetical protein